MGEMTRENEMRLEFLKNNRTIKHRAAENGIIE
jgi:hypothetical protein